MPAIHNPLTELPLDDLEVALNASEALMQHKQFLPSGLLLMLVSRFRDDTREAIGMEPERFPATEKHGRGKIIRSLDDLTSTELGKVSAAVDALLDKRFTAVMDDPELPALLRKFKAGLDAQKTERAQIQASIAS
jgi:hypothetical protein